MVLALLALLAAGLPFDGTVPSEQVMALGQAGAWSVYKTTVRSHETCYAFTTAAGRPSSYLLVSYWPGADALEVEILPGYLYEPRESVSMNVEGYTKTFFTQNYPGGGKAWGTGDDDDALIARMQGASKASVRARPLSAAWQTDEYALDGLAAAIARMKASCVEA